MSCAQCGQGGPAFPAPTMLGDWAELNVPLSAVEYGGLGWGFLKVGTDGSISSATSGIVPSAPCLAETEQGAEVEREGEGQVGGGTSKFTDLPEQAWDQ